MVGFKGQVSMKQYLPLKPVKRGIKIWERADSSNGYVCNLQVYTGKQDGGVTEHGLGYSVVRELMEPFLHKYHHVFCDNFSHRFLSPAICLESKLICEARFDQIVTACLQVCLPRMPK